MKNKLTLGVMALAMVGILSMSLVAAFPMMGGNWDISEEDKLEHQTFMDQVREAIENEDFETWESLMMSQITLDNFNDHVERHADREELREQKEQCLEDPENCEFEDWKGKGKYYDEKEGKNWGELKEQCSENSEDCPYKNKGQMHKDFNQEQKQHRWAFWKGFGKNRA
jgi:hypothetical protein